MENLVRNPDTRFADRIELWLGTSMAVAVVVLIAIGLVSFIQLLLEFERLLKPLILKM